MRNSALLARLITVIGIALTGYSIGHACSCTDVSWETPLAKRIGPYLDASDTFIFSATIIDKKVVPAGPRDHGFPKTQVLLDVDHS